MSDTPDLAALTPVARRSASYYRDMAIACRRSAAIERAHRGGVAADRLVHARVPQQAACAIRRLLGIMADATTAGAA